MGFRVSGAGWYDYAYSHLDNTNNATANTLVNGLPVAGALSPYTKRYAKGVSGELLDAFVFANFDVGRRAGQRQGRPAHRLLGRQPAARRRDPRRFVRDRTRSTSGRASRRRAAKRRSCSGRAAASRCRRSRRKDLSVAGAMVLQLAGGSHSRIGQLPDDPGPAQLRRRLVHLRTQSARRGDSGRAGVPAPVARRRTSSRRRTPAASATGAFRRAGAPTGSTARSASTIAIRPTSSRRRWRRRASLPVPAAACTARGGMPLPGGTLCFVNPNATTVADLQKFGKLGLYNGAYGDNIHIYGITLAKSIAGVSVGAELSYRQNMPLASDPVQVLPAAFVPLVPGSIATTAVPTQRHAGRAGRHVHGVLNAREHLPVDRRCSIPRRSRASSPGCSGRRSRRTRRCSRAAATTRRSTRSSKNFFGLAINFTPTWFQVFPGVDLLAPVTWSQGISGNSAVAVRRQRGRRQLERRHRRRHLPEVPDRSQVQRLLRQLLDRPRPAPRPRAASWACPTAPTHRCPIAAGSRSRSRPPSERGTAIMFRRTLLAASFAAIFATGAHSRRCRPTRRSSSARR